MMKIIISFLILLLSQGADAATLRKKKPKAPNAPPISAVVGYVFDGDTFAAVVNISADIKISVRVRIINIDTPEMNGECPSEIAGAIAARTRLMEIIQTDSIVELSEVKDDKYLGRIDARVKTKTGADVGEMMISENHARRYSGGKRMGWCE